MGILQNIKEFKDRVFNHPVENDFIALNKANQKSTGQKSKKLNLLVQMPEDYFYLILFSSVLKSLRKDTEVSIGWLNLNTRLESGGIFNFVKKSPIFDRKWENLYLSNGGEVAYRYLFDLNKIKPEILNTGRKIFSSLKKKEDVLLIESNGIKLGDLIYDTYLRYKPAATVDITDPFLEKVILSALDNSERLTDLFQKNHYDLLLTSYCTYVQHGIAVRVAHKYGVKVVSFGSYDQLSKVVEPDFPNHIKNYLTYRKSFLDFDHLEIEKCLKIASQSLNGRFSGGIDSSTFYMSKSSYHQEQSAEKTFNDTGNKRIVVFLHDFFDSPHVYRSMLYPDFYEWLNDTLSILDKTEYDIYVKPHPNGIIGNEPVVTEILNRFPNVNLISKTISNKVLISEGFDLAVSVYGTLGHEMPYFGIPVLNAGDNPHVNYRFCTTATSRFEYETGLLKIESVPRPELNCRSEIDEFYYMHNFFLFPGKLPVEENKYLNDELRKIDNVNKFQVVLQKYKNEDYSKKIDQLIEKSIKEVI